MSKNIIVTGGSRGIGYALTDYFLTRGCNVVFSGTSEESIQKAKAKFDEKHDTNSSIGLVANICDYSSSESLIQECTEKFGSMDIFINNAGVDQTKTLFKDVDKNNIDKVIDINLKGSMFGTLAALEYFKKQGSGAVYVMEGFGSDDRMGDQMVIYGSSKRAIRYFGRSLAKEMRDTGIIVGTLSPGMVATDFLKKSLDSMEKSQAESTKKIFNILADTPEDVAQFLGDNILKNKKNGAKIFWLTTPKIMGRFLTAGFRKRELF